MFRYKPCYVKCPTGRFVMAGTLPYYLSVLSFETEETAKQAEAEALKWFETGQVDNTSRFAMAYLEGDHNASYIRVKETPHLHKWTWDEEQDNWVCSECGRLACVTRRRPHAGFGLALEGQHKGGTWTHIRWISGPAAQSAQ